MRAVMIALGAQLLHSFEWLLYLFGLFLLITGVRMLFVKEKPHDLGSSRIIKFLRRYLPVTDELHGNKFIARVRVIEAGHTKPRLRPYVTPLLLALVMVEVSDLIFAVDSVPAVLAITQDPFIVYTSNIFAILGLRALYFALSAMIQRFDMLKYALALVLIFIGMKVVIGPIAGPIPSWVSLCVTTSLLAGASFCHWRDRIKMGDNIGVRESP